MFLCSDEFFVVQKGKGGGSSNLLALPAAIRTRKRVRAFMNLSRSSCAIILRGGGTRLVPALLSGGSLAETSRQDPRQSLAEHPCIRWAVAVEHARFIEQQMRGIPLEGQILIAQRSERYDDVVPRVDFQDRLRGALNAPGAGQYFFQLPIEAGFRRDQADRAIGQPVRGANVRHRLAQRVLDQSQKMRDRLIGLGRRFIRGVEARDERQIRCPLRDRFEGLAFKGGG